MDDALERARSARNVLERLGARVPGFAGYLERELRREVDQTLRRTLAARLDRVRSLLAAHLRTLSLADARELQRLAALDKAADTAANRLRHAGSGFAGFFAAAKIGEGELEAVYRCDLALVEEVEAAEAATGAGGETGVDSSALETALTRLRAALDRRAAVLGGFGNA